MKHVCNKCHGRKMYMSQVVHELIIEKGWEEGEEMVLEGQSNQHIEADPGDLIFKFSSSPHPRFRRQNNINLQTNITISLLEALTGFERQIIHLDNHVVKISRNQVTQNNEILVIKNEGMPKRKNPSQFGDLFVQIFVKDFPKQLSSSDKERKKKKLFQFRFFITNPFFVKLLKSCCLDQTNLFIIKFFLLQNFLFFFHH